MCGTRGREERNTNSNIESRKSSFMLTKVYTRGRNILRSVAIDSLIDSTMYVCAYQDLFTEIATHIHGREMMECGLENKQDITTAMLQ